MVRFTAHTSDLSDSDSEQEDVFTAQRRPSTTSQPQRQPQRQSQRQSQRQRQSQDSQRQEHSDDSSSTSSDLHEEELAPPPPPRKKRPTRTAFVEDENGRSSSPQPHRHPNPATPWAQQVGVDAQRMQLMQVSMFRMPEDAATLKAMSEPKRTSILIDKALRRKHSRGSDGDPLRAESHERTTFAHHVQPPPFRPTRKFARVDCADSVVRGNERSLVDAGLSLGRSFRVGWGPRGTIAHLGALCSPSASIKTSANSSVVSVSTFPVISQLSREAVNLMAKLLQHHQSNSPIGRDENSVPHIFLTRALNFASFVSIFSPTDRSYEASLFRLGHALFDETDLRLGESASTTTRNRIASLRRKTAVSAWLEDVVSPSVDADLRKASSADNAAACFTYLTGNQVEKACDAAIAGHNFMLSTLVSQASGGGSEFQTDLRAQLEIWRDQRIDVHIGEDVRKVYALLAGIVDTLEGSKGTGLEKCPDMLIHKDLDWKRIYGLHLWYSEPGEASLGTVFRSFDEFWQSTKTASPPKAPHQPTYWNVPSKPPPLDAPFSLLKLQADPTCSLSQTLTPLSFSSSPIDYCFPWHLYTILSRCMRVRDFADRSDHGVGNLSGDMDVDRSGDAEDEGALWGEGHSPTADLVACSYAFQLECLGMIQQAAFVLLHIEEVNGRRKAIMDLLMRSAPLLNDENKRGLVSTLRIPEAWVNEAKATMAFSEGDVFKAYDLYLQAGLYDRAHDLAVLELAPDAIYRWDHELLQSLFERFIGHPVDGWHDRGKRLLEYAHIMTRVPELQKIIEERTNVPEGAQAELDQLLKTVPALIDKLPLVLPRPDPGHKAALAEMVTQLMNLVRPTVLAQSLAQPPLLGDSAKLREINTAAYERFLDAIQVS